MTLRDLIALPNASVKVEERPGYLLVVESGTLGDVHEVRAYTAAMDALVARTGMDRAIIDARGEIGDQSAEVRAAMWDWLTAPDRRFAVIAFVLPSEMAVARVNMTSLSRRAAVRAFDNVQHAQRWLMRNSRSVPNMPSASSVEEEDTEPQLRTFRSVDTLRMQSLRTIPEPSESTKTTWAPEAKESTKATWPEPSDSSRTTQSWAAAPEPSDSTKATQIFPTRSDSSEFKPRPWPERSDSKTFAALAKERRDSETQRAVAERIATPLPKRTTPDVEVPRSGTPKRRPVATKVQPPKTVKPPAGSGFRPPSPGPSEEVRGTARDKSGNNDDDDGSQLG